MYNVWTYGRPENWPMVYTADLNESPLTSIRLAQSAWPKPGSVAYRLFCNTLSVDSDFPDAHVAHGKILSRDSIGLDDYSSWQCTDSAPPQPAACGNVAIAASVLNNGSAVTVHGHGPPLLVSSSDVRRYRGPTMTGFLTESTITTDSFKPFVSTELRLGDGAEVQAFFSNHLNNYFIFIDEPDLPDNLVDRISTACNTSSSYTRAISIRGNTVRFFTHSGVHPSAPISGILALASYCQQVGNATHSWLLDARYGPPTVKTINTSPVVIEDERITYHNLRRLVGVGVRVSYA